MTIMSQEVQGRRVGVGVALGIIIVFALALGGCATKSGYIRVQTPLGAAGTGSKGRTTIIFTNASLEGVVMSVRIGSSTYCDDTKPLGGCSIPLGTNWDTKSSKEVVVVVVGVNADGSPAGVLEKKVTIPRFSKSVATRDIPLTVRRLQ